jgi:hypothetical protein
MVNMDFLGPSCCSKSHKRETGEWDRKTPSNKNGTLRRKEAGI